jgi:hypothetical protein
VHLVERFCSLYLTHKSLSIKGERAGRRDLSEIIFLPGFHWQVASGPPGLGRGEASPQGQSHPQQPPGRVPHSLRPQQPYSLRMRLRLENRDRRATVTDGASLRSRLYSSADAPAQGGTETPAASVPRHKTQHTVRQTGVRWRPILFSSESFTNQQL